MTVKMDTRMTNSNAGLQKKFEIETHLASVVSESTQALLQGGSVRLQLDKLKPQRNANLKSSIEDFEKKLNALLGAPAGFLAPPSQEVTLSRLNSESSTLYQQVWQVDAEPTSAQLEAAATVDRDRADALQRWTEFKSTELPAMNRLLRQSSVPEINLQAPIHQDEPAVDEE